LSGILGDVMRLLSIAKATLLIAVLGLAACATGTGVTVSDLYKPNYGVHVFPHFDASADPDPAAIANGLYVPRTLRGVPSQSSWAP
jgi:hypothetical protein